jgi:hypothetical protein
LSSSCGPEGAFRDYPSVTVTGYTHKDQIIAPVEKERVAKAPKAGS